MRKYKIGDKVRINVNNRVATITSFEKIDDMEGYGLNGGHMPVWWDSELTLEKSTFNANDLKDGDIVTLRNGDKMIWSEYEERFYDIEDTNSNCLYDMGDLNDNMTMTDRDDKDSDIMKVERAVEYETVFNRDETVKEMTIDEISRALGYEVKIVKEDKKND